eukprot:TRINITY_DN1790_c0_g1_i2.p1 TRINITY_DN1790_c0_g1~~TRINITY_DN1790_c0_g1_i2.p1  ORF type:complete len:210 (+),score=62.03 TRINITY_DN1790_c0_g1_i2:616-1245(+)
MRRLLHPEVSTWVDVAPMYSGSLRTYQAVTASLEGRLQLMDLTELTEPDLREQLTALSPAVSEAVSTEEERLETLKLSLLRRFRPQDTVAIVKPYNSAAVEGDDDGGDGHQQGAFNYVEEGHLLADLCRLPPHYRDDYMEWTKVMLLCKPLSGPCGEAAWDEFDTWSVESDRYNRWKNRRTWDTMNVSMTPELAIKRLRKLARAFAAVE